MATPWRYIYTDELYHYGVKGQKWGVKRGPPYPLTNFAKNLTNDSDGGKIVREAIQNGTVKTEINREKQLRHIAGNKKAIGRSYIFGDLKTAQEIVDMYFGTGRALVIDTKWQRKEKIMASKIIGIHVDENGIAKRTRYAHIIYSNTGAHVIPCEEDIYVKS